MTNSLSHSWWFWHFVVTKRTYIFINKCNCLFICVYSTLFSRPLGIFPRAPTRIVITVTFILHIFFSSPVRSWYLSNILLSFIFTPRSARKAKFTRWQVLFFLLTLSLVFWSGFDSWFVSQSPREFYVFHFLGLFLLYEYTNCLSGQTLVSYTNFF